MLISSFFFHSLSFQLKDDCRLFHSWRPQLTKISLKCFYFWKHSKASTQEVSFGKGTKNKITAKPGGGIDRMNNASADCVCRSQVLPSTDQPRRVCHPLHNLTHLHVSVSLISSPSSTHTAPNFIHFQILYVNRQLIYYANEVSIISMQMTPLNCCIFWPFN